MKTALTTQTQEMVEVSEDSDLLLLTDQIVDKADEGFNRSPYYSFKEEKYTEKDITFDVGAIIVIDLDEKVESIKTLEQIHQLPDDWDSYGSPRLSDASYNYAYDFLCTLMKTSMFPDFPKPFIVPVSGGGVQFEWQSGGRELELDFSDPNQIEFLKVYEDFSMEDGCFSSNRQISCLKLLKWLLTGN